MTIFNLAMIKSVGGIGSKVIDTSELMSCDFSSFWLQTCVHSRKIRGGKKTAIFAPAFIL